MSPKLVELDPDRVRANAAANKLVLAVKLCSSVGARYIAVEPRLQQRQMAKSCTCGSTRAVYDLGHRSGFFRTAGSTSLRGIKGDKDYDNCFTWWPTLVR